MSRRLPIATAALLLFVFAGPAPAQDTARDWREFLMPDVNEVRPWMYMGVDFDPEQGSDQFNTHIKSARYDLDVSVPIMPTITDRSMALQFRAGMRDMKTMASLPSTGSSFPEPLIDVGLGAIYRWRLDGGKMAALNFSFASPSDDPFDDHNDVAVRGSGLLRIPAGERNAWLWFIHYQSDRDHAARFPLPGFGYLYRPSDKFMSLVGYPYSTFFWQASDRVHVTGDYVASRKVSAEIGRKLSTEVTLIAGARWNNEAYYRASSHRKNDRLTLDEKRVTGGFRYKLGDDVHADFYGGLGFDRFWYEGETYADRRFNRVRIDDGLVCGINFTARF